MSTTIPEWVSKALTTGHEQRIAQGRLIPGHEQAHLTLNEQAFREQQLRNEKTPLLGEAVVFESLDKLNKKVGRRHE